MLNIIKDIKEMRIQSANTIAIESLKYLKKIANKYDFGKKFYYVSKKLEDARPTAVGLHNCLEIIKKEKNIATIDNLINKLSNAPTIIAKNASMIFPKNRKVTILTHCHSTNVVKTIIKNKKYVKSVFVTETRPRDQGLLTAKDLLKKKIPVEYMIDSAIGYYINQIDFVLVGADALRKEGLINKIGTYPIAVVAKENKKPFYVVTSTFTLDKRNKFIIEERPKSEITNKHISGAKLHNPAFDITPWKYVSLIITEKGIHKPDKIINGDFQ
ncbi:MAG: hypothetical protein QXD48_01375 [Candidatus Aenigmatarchaeota archaeon]